MVQTAADVLVERLLAWGVDVIFGIPGDGINGLVEALRKERDRIRFIHVRHEEVGARRPLATPNSPASLGVCFGTAGPGVHHLTNGLYDARLDQAPLLAIGGMTYHDLLGTSEMQGDSIDYLFPSVAVYNQGIMGPAHVRTVMDIACRTALAHRGPAFVGFPRDIQSMSIDDARPSGGNVPRHTSAVYAPPRRVPTPDRLQAAADLLNGNSKIAILAGAGARGARAELEAVAEKLAAPIGKALLGKDCIPDDSPYVMGPTAHAGSSATNLAFAECDAFLIVGSTMPYLEFYPKPGQAATVQIDDKPERIGLRCPVAVDLVGDAKATLQALAPLLEAHPDRSFLETAQQRTRGWRNLMEQRGTCIDAPMKPQVPAWLLSDLLADDAIVCGDAGTVTFWQARQLRLRGAQRFSFRGTNCTMASGLSYAIGAQTAFPLRQVVAFTGDGSMTMHLGDFLTLMQYDLPVKVIVIDNGTLGLEKWEQMYEFGNPEFGNALAPIDLVKFAEACGAHGVRIDDATRCRDQLAEALAHEGPVLVQAVVDPSEPVLEAPLTPVHARNYFDAIARGGAEREVVADAILADLRQEQQSAPDAINAATRHLMQQLESRAYRHDSP